jgi:hypothetical protein
MKYTLETDDLVRRLNIFITETFTKLTHISKERDVAVELATQEVLKVTQLHVELDETRKALEELELAEQHYRSDHDVKGDGSLDAGHAWDHMRHSGDHARTILKKYSKLKEQP